MRLLLAALFLFLTACGSAELDNDATFAAAKKRPPPPLVLVGQPAIEKYDCGHDNGTCTCTNDDDCDALFSSGRCVEGTEGWVGKDDGVCDDSHD